MKIRRLTICDWHDSGRTDTVVENPSWVEVESAIRALNNRNLNDVHLELECDADVSLTVGGGSGKYIVSGSVGTESFPTLTQTLVLEEGKMKIRAVALSGLLLASMVQASGYLTGLDQGVSVTRYLMHSGGGMTVWVSGISNPDGCGGSDRVHLKGNLPGHDKMVSAVLAASASGRRVGFWSSGCEVIPFWGGTQTVPIVADLWVVE